MPRQCVRLFDRLQKIEGAHDFVSVVGITSAAVVVQHQYFGMQRFAIVLIAPSAWSVMPDLPPVIFAAVGVSAYLNHFGYSLPATLRVVGSGGVPSYMLFLDTSVGSSGDLLLRCARWVYGDDHTQMRCQGMSNEEPFAACFKFHSPAFWDPLGHARHAASTRPPSRACCAPSFFL